MWAIVVLKTWNISTGYLNPHRFCMEKKTLNPNSKSTPTRACMKVLMSTIPNLIETTGISYTVKNIRSGFVANSQNRPLL